MALIRCPECGNQISQFATSCPYCGCPGSRFTNIRTDGKDVWRECPACRKTQSIDSRFCQECGSPLIETAGFQADNPPGHSNGPQYTGDYQQTYQIPDVELPSEQDNIAGRKVKTWFTESLLATIFCCLAFGIPALVFSVIAQDHVKHERYEMAQKSAKQAMIWFWLSFGFGVITTALWIWLEFIAKP